jgi:hypothetical protein
MSIAKKPDSQIDQAVDALEDAEIDKIMSEIEDLQQEMNRAETQASTPKKLHAVAKTESAEDNDVSKASSSSPSQEEMSAEMEAEVSELLSSSNDVQPTERDTTMTDGADTSEGSMTLSMSGNMTLRLNYEIEGQVVTIGFVDQTLTVELADGTEFKIPLHRTSAKAA